MLKTTRGTIAAAALFLGFGAASAVAEDQVVNVYNWSDYIDEQVLEDFTKETGIKVVYDVYDNNDIVETKLLAGGSGYDIVVPTDANVARQIKAGTLKPLDKAKLPNLVHMWPFIMEKLATYDPGNQYAVNYMWGTSGLGINVDKVKERLPEAPLDSWKLLFDPAVAGKLKDCGIMVLDAADDVLPSALTFIGENPDSKDPKVLEKGAEVVQKVRPSIRKFHSSENINALANGDICLSLMFSGDAGIAATRAEEAKNGVDIEYVIPQEGAQLWFDMMAIPTDAQNVENAYAFINYLLEPEVMAKISNFVTYPNAVPASLPLIDEEVKGDPNLFPPAELRQKLFVVTPYDQKVQRAVTRLWTRIVTGS